MKRYSLILCMVLFVSLSGVASAQIVLGPPAAAGSVVFCYATLGGAPQVSTSFTSTYPAAGGSASAGNIGGIKFSFYWATHGVVEFYIGAATFPTTMTANNFTARLDGLTVTSSATGALNAMNVDLFDMGDTAEDGSLTIGDFDNTRGSRIARRTHYFGGAPANFNDINVTDAVRNDLFGAGAGNYSGFILKPANLNIDERWVSYDKTSPTLTINPGVKPSGGGGGGGGGCFIVNAAR